MTVKRRYLGEIVRLEADRAMLETFEAAFSCYNSFLVYSSFSTEARTDLLIERLLSEGKRVYLPRVEGERLAPVLYGELKKGAFGINEPVGEEYKGEIDVTVVPLLAVNERGYRIGYGKGYYDRFLKGRKTLKVGYGYDFQIEDFTEDEWDEPLDLYLSERGIYTFGK